ncbi:ATP-binding protein [Rhizobium calliandrae]|uniref:ATP-binding protein n=1 Tax=Rhizobium calliandrae TaxID=1312182 RepID=A0ABT7KF98_9HYPH|nr:ATP-binding protein [Rhizobium calliandrae]MDL2407293.1 ATP-binding protein [Rhizobium calliandrae]
MDFLGRDRELKLVRNELDSSRPSLIILFGRRRIGKSRFLREVAKGRDEIYFQATRVSSLLNLEQFKAEVGKTIGLKPQLNALSNWEGVLHYVAEHAAERQGLIITIDEFPYLLDDEPALPSILQKFWDSGVLGQGAMKLILCGSAISQMEELLAERNPLYGRKTLSMDMKQLPLSDVAKFFPEYRAEDIIRAYSIFGGIPYYLQLCNSSESLRDNVINLLLTETGTLIDEPNTLLQTELREPAFYSSILAAVSSGCNSKSEIANRLGVKADNIGPYMAKLLTLDLINNPKSLDADEKGRNRRYRIADSLISFWHRFVRQNLTAISSGFGEDVYDRIVEPQFSDYMGIEFEDIALEYAKLHIQEILGVPAQEVGQIWGHADFDIDVAGRLLDGAFFYGECKWKSRTIDLGHVRVLRERSEKTTYGKGAVVKHFLLFSRVGFSSDVIDLAKKGNQLHLLTPEILVKPRG